MRIITKITLPVAIAVTALSSIHCYSDDNQNPEALSPIYTFLKDCTATTNHDNAAFNELTCPSIKGYKIKITEHPPQFFNIHIKKGTTEAITDFIAVTNENPLKAGKAIEWHFEDDKPRFMIFRLSWGSEVSPFEMREHLVLNYIDKSDICSIATVEVNNNNANYKVRELMLKQFSEIKACPDTILKI